MTNELIERNDFYTFSLSLTLLMGMAQWLDSFAYHIEFSWTYIVLAGLVAIVITALTVSQQTIKSAISNPIKSLRDE